MSNYILSADLAQVNDYTAISTLQIPGNGFFNLPSLDRLTRGMSYPDQVSILSSRLAGLQSLARSEGGYAALVLDGTGVGKAVVDIARDAGLDPYVINITAGKVVNQSGKTYNVPKLDLISAAQVALQNGVLRIAKDMPNAETFKKELQAFTMRVNIATGNQTFEAWRNDGAHDDMVLSVAMAVWLATKGNLMENILSYYARQAALLRPAH